MDTQPLMVPTPRVDVAIRAATPDDLPALDALQRRYCRALGFFPARQFAEYVAGGNVLVAEEGHGGERHEGIEARRHEGVMEGERGAVGRAPSSLPASLPRPHSVPACLRASVPAASPLAYLIARDRYLKRDELGVIYQVCVAPGSQRKLIGASLVKAAFERSAYGCRLYCCWCAQDLAANRFWESLGFVPIAFRAGSGRKKRVHVFWQKRIVEGDETTPWWYPFKTDQGAMRADRLVFPIPPGTHWSAVRPPELPRRQLSVASGQLPVKAKRAKSSLATRNSPLATSQIAIVVGGRVKYVDRPGGVPPARPAPPASPDVATALPVPLRRPRAAAPKLAPTFLAAARELRDRYLERLNAGGGRLLSPGAKYDVRRLPAPDAPPSPARLLPSAA